MDKYDFMWLFYWCWNKAVIGVGAFINFVVQFLPEWNFNPDLSGAPIQVISFINWIFPMETLAFCISVLTVNYMSYFTIGILLRWAKVTQ